MEIFIANGDSYGREGKNIFMISIRHFVRNRIVASTELQARRSMHTEIQCLNPLPSLRNPNGNVLVLHIINVSSHFLLTSTIIRLVGFLP